MAGETININSLFADILPDPAAEMRQQQSDLLSVLDTVGGVAALNAPQQQQQLRYAAGGLFGIDTRTGSEKLREAMKGVDPNNPQDLIRLASMADSIDPAKAVQIRQSAAQLTKQQRDEKEARERKLVEQQQADTTFAMNRATALEALTSDVTAREEVGQQREANAALVDSSTVLSETEQANYKQLINSGAFDGKQADLLKITNPSPLIFGNNAIVRDKDGKWTSVVAPADVLNKAGLQAAAKLRFKDSPENLALLTTAINNGAVTDIKDFDEIIPEAVELGSVPTSVETMNGKIQEGVASAFASNNRMDDILKTIEEQGLITYGAGGIEASVRSFTLKQLGERDTIEYLRTAYEREKNTEIINSLPPGVASDRDIQIFSKGFPPDDAEIIEVYEYLQAARNINYVIQDRGALFDKHLESQIKSGREATSVGFNSAFRDFTNSANAMRVEEERLRNAMANGTVTEQQANAEFSKIMSDFEEIYGFLPSSMSSNAGAR